MYNVKLNIFEIPSFNQKILSPPQSNPDDDYKQTTGTGTENRYTGRQTI